MEEENFMEKQKNSKTDPKRLLTNVGESKTHIENTLEQNEHQLGKVLSYANELVTNIQVANEKRELDRIDFQTSVNNELSKDIQREYEESLQRLQNISYHWKELATYKEPMTLYEELDKQKERIQELMESKAKIIEQCQAEIKRVDAKYNVEIGKQATDICSLVERIDSEIELLKLFFEKNLILLQNTVESDKKIIAQTASKKWSTYFETMLENEEKNFINTKEQRILYSKSIQKITEQQDKILRSMRIRLDKNSEMLEWELQNTKGNVLMNSEKLDYNYQVLLKKNDENNIIHTQQKRRVARLNESLCMVKQKISNFDFNKKCHCTKLTADIKKLHYFISELEKKLACVKESYTNKVNDLWRVNIKTTEALIKRVYEIDKTLYEQEFNFSWSRKPIDLSDISLTEKPSSSIAAIANAKKLMIMRQNKFRSYSGKATNKILQKSILNKLSQSANYMIDPNLMKLLESYSAKEKRLVRIDNIFSVLHMKDPGLLTSLMNFLQQYAWCPNCSKEKAVTSYNQLMNLDKLEDDSIAPLHNKPVANCIHHFLVMESSMILSCINTFMAQYNNQTDTITEILEKRDRDKFDINVIIKFWRNCMTYMPPKSKKSWNALEHGLYHYIEVLRKKNQLNNECILLRKRNSDLKNLLQAYV